MLCVEDKTEHESLSALHKHLRKIGIKQEDYYVKHYAKKDLFTGQAIPFKDAEQYLKADFINKVNLRKFLQANSPAAQQWAKEWLKRRKEEKGLVYAPTQVELRSLVAPSIKYYNHIGNYNDICKEIGLIPRFTGKLQFKKLSVNEVVIQDTREQKPIAIAATTEIGTLNVGDYGLETNPHNVYIERKSLNDFVGTLGTKINKKAGSYAKLGFERFRAELLRAKEQGIYLIMVVENDINEALGFNFLPQMRWVKTNPDHIFSNLRKLLHEFQNFQVVFTKGRESASEVILKIFEAGETAKNVDLQLAYENGEL